MNKTWLYSTQSLAASGFAIMSSVVAWRLRPDLWASAQEAGFDFKPRTAIEGTERLQVTLVGVGTVLVLTRSTDQLAQRIEWITGFRVERIEAAPLADVQTNGGGIVAEMVARRHADEKLAQIKAVAQQEPPAHDCAQRREILAARTELARLTGNLPQAPVAVPGWRQRAEETKAEPVQVAGDGANEGEPDRERARNLISSLLAAGPRKAAEILTAAEGDSINERTLQRAADDLGVLKTKDGFAGGWVWTLPVEAAA